MWWSPRREPPPLKPRQEPPLWKPSLRGPFYRPFRTKLCKEFPILEHYSLSCVLPFLCFFIFQFSLVFLPLSFSSFFPGIKAKSWNFLKLQGVSLRCAHTTATQPTKLKTHTMVWQGRKVLDDSEVFLGEDPPIIEVGTFPDSFHSPLTLQPPRLFGRKERKEPPPPERQEFFSSQIPHNPWKRSQKREKQKKTKRKGNPQKQWLEGEGLRRGKVP